MLATAARRVEKQGGGGRAERRAERGELSGETEGEKEKMIKQGGQDV